MPLKPGRELLSALYGNFKDPNDPTSLRARVDALQEIVMCLLVEVEALRTVQMASDAKGTPPSAAPYAQAYREAALLTHNSAGPTSGWDKMMTLWFDGTERGRAESRMRELVLLRRLGYTEDEIREYVAEAEHLEQLT